jgi:glycosyltransferase involved in cell wall biosynthesis
MKKSICMATYNGELFIKEQMDSILAQLQDDDEIIIVDDCSQDSTLELLRKENDCRIKIFVNNTNQGHVFSFSKALMLATNEVIFLSDQDDVWEPDRVELMMNELTKSNKLFLSSNYSHIDANGSALIDFLPKLRKCDSERHIFNIFGIFAGTRPYSGCAIAFKRELLPIILPIPSHVESHDLWIAMASNIIKSNIHFEYNTLKRRWHGNNFTPLKRRSLNIILISRFKFAYSFLCLLSRIIWLRSKSPPK